MKTMTCNQLGGACEKEFQAQTFEEMGEMSAKHGVEMVQKGDEDHPWSYRDRHPRLEYLLV